MRDLDSNDVNTARILAWDSLIDDRPTPAEIGDMSDEGLRRVLAGLQDREAAAA